MVSELKHAVDHVHILETHPQLDALLALVFA
jgi:hypothetical protein